MTKAVQMFESLLPDEVATAEAGSTAKSQPKPVPIVPVPSNAPLMQYRHRDHGEPSKAWPYHDADGRVVGYVLRSDFTGADGEPGKEIRPICYCEMGNFQRAWCLVGMLAARRPPHTPSLARRYRATRRPDCP